MSNHIPPSERRKLAVQLAILLDSNEMLDQDVKAMRAARNPLTKETESKVADVGSIINTITTYNLNA